MGLKTDGWTVNRYDKKNDPPRWVEFIKPDGEGPGAIGWARLNGDHYLFGDSYDWFSSWCGRRRSARYAMPKAEVETTGGAS